MRVQTARSMLLVAVCSQHCFHRCWFSGGATAAGGGAPAPAGFRPPAKSLMNLATAIDSLAFSPDQQVQTCDDTMCCLVQPLLLWHTVPGPLLGLRHRTRRVSACQTVA